MTDLTDRTLPGDTASLAGPPAPSVPAASDGGLGHDDIVADPFSSVQVQAGPWADLVPGDTVSVFWGDPDRPAASLAARPGDEGAFLSLYVAKSLIRARGDGVHRVWYTVLTGFGEDTLVSPETPVTVKMSRPGGEDPLPDTDLINDALAAPVVAPDPVTDADQQATVTLAPWLNMAPGDVPALSWGGIVHTGQPVDPAAVGRPVTFTLSRADLEAGGGGLRPVTYSVRDVVNNWSGFAPYALVDVGIEDPDALEAPEVAEADPDGTLDLAVLGERDATLQVPRYYGVAPGDVVVARWDGQTAAGQALAWESAPLTVPPQMPFVFEFAVPNDRVTALAGGFARASYAVTSRGLTSRRLTLQVTGEPAGLAPPAVPAAADGVLDPAAVPQGAAAVVEAWPGMAPGDRVTLWWEGTTAAGLPTQYSAQRRISGSGAGRPVSFTVPAAEVEALRNGRVRLYYVIDTFTAAGAGRAAFLLATLRSPELLLEVREAGSALLPAPVLDDVRDGLLDPDLPETTVRVPQYPGMAQGDRVDLTWTGATVFTDWLPVERPEALEFWVDGEVIRASEGGDVAVGYAVTPAAGGPAQGSALTTFAVGEPAVEPPPLPALPAPEVAELEADGTLRPDAPRATVTPAAGVPLYRGDVVVTAWTDAQGELAETQRVAANGEAPAALLVPGARVAQAEGETVRVGYRVTRGAEEKASPVREVPVRLPAPPIPDLPDPVCWTAVDGTVRADLDFFNVWIPETAFLNAGDEVTVTVTGMRETREAVLTLESYQTRDLVAGFEGSEVLLPHRTLTIDVHYKVVRGTDVKRSRVLTIQVGPEREPDMSLVDFERHNYIKRYSPGQSIDVLKDVRLECGYFGDIEITDEYKDYQNTRGFAVRMLPNSKTNFYTTRQIKKVTISITALSSARIAISLNQSKYTWVDLYSGQRYVNTFYEDPNDRPTYSIYIIGYEPFEGVLNYLDIRY